MSRSFDYQSSSVEAIAAHLNTIQKQAYYRLVTYYTKKSNTGMLGKLEQARMLSAILKLQDDYSSIYGKL